LINLKHLSEDSIAIAESIFRWAMENMWNGDGFFYYKKFRAHTIRTSYMRWSQAWMLLAMSVLLNDARSRRDTPLEAPTSPVPTMGEILVPGCGVSQ
jgi:hypothetical protein